MTDSGLGANSGIAVPRLAVAMAASIGVTFGLFMVMVNLVAFSDELDLDEGETFRFVDVIEDIVETPPQRIERKIEKPPEVETPPPEVDVPVQTLDGPSSLDLSIGPANVSSGANLTCIDLGPSQDGDYLPLVRVQPQFPRRAQERGVGGYVIVELTVAPDGSVPPESIKIIEAEPKGYFERASIKAAQKFKYKPKVVNGQPQEVVGVTYRFTFNLEDDGRRR